MGDDRRQRHRPQPRRPEHARNQTRTIRGRGLVADLARQTGARFVQFRNQMLQTIIGLRRLVGVEGVGLEEIDARIQILPPDILDDVGTRQRQKVIVALQIGTMIAETGTTEISCSLSN